MVDKVNAVVLSGGSAFGLDAASGVVKWLDERGIGWQTGRRQSADRHRRDPVSTSRSAAIRQCGRRPTAATGQSAAASAAPVGEGSVGAGAGATVGKIGEHAERSASAHQGRHRQRRDHPAQRPRRRGHRRGQRRRATSSIRPPVRSSPARAIPTARSPTSARCCAPGQAADRALPGREHDHRRRRDQRGAVQGRHQPRGADGRRWAGAGDLSVAHRRRRRYGVCARHRTLEGRGVAHRRSARSRPTPWPRPSSARPPKPPASPASPPAAICKVNSEFRVSDRLSIQRLSEAYRIYRQINNDD